MDDRDKTEHAPRIFLCHASEDKPRARDLYRRLQAAGYRPWLDREDLLPGQDWSAEIRRIIGDPYNLVLVCLSRNSVTKRGVVQQEIKWALDVLDQMPERAIYLIPARLEPCPVPDRLGKLHWVDLFEPDGFEKLKQALDLEIASRRAEPAPTAPPPSPALARVPASPARRGWSERLRAHPWGVLSGVVGVALLAGILYIRWPGAWPATSPGAGLADGAPTAGRTALPSCESGVAPAVEELDDLVAVPAATFTMGDNQGERPRHQVAVPAFSIDRFEVTNLQYREFLEATGRPAPRQWDGLGYPPGQTAFQPVVNVTWADADAYCAWAGKRLPTEAEWELACRGPAGRQYPWGAEPDPARANTLESGCGEAQTVGSYSPDGDSVYGAADMVGNVSEWVSSVYAPYPYQPASHEAPPDAETMRVVRSGSRQATQAQGSCPVRSPAPPEMFGGDTGFRCARSADQP
jgi:iron(II)-dependent oxidoreductase